jgi:hypothetical protein
MFPPSSLGKHVLHRTLHLVKQRLDQLRMQKYTRYLYANNKLKTTYQTPRNVTNNILFCCTAHLTNIVAEFNTAHYIYNIYFVVLHILQTPLRNLIPHITYTIYILLYCTSYKHRYGI